VSNVILKCELCSNPVERGARLCASCAEMVERVAHANAELVRRNAVEAPAEELQKKSQRARAKAEKLTPVILG
jgi:hypothetical protein